VGFSGGAEVVVKQISDKDWEVREPFSYSGKSETFKVAVGQQTDFASVPRVFIWLLPRYGRYTLAAILHDHLWRDRASADLMNYIDADGTFRRAMRELGVPFLRRWVMWAAVRWGALVKPHGRRLWLRESWRVLPLTLVVLPIVLPPALVILVALGLFELLEAIVWVPLRLTLLMKQQLGRPIAKAVNPPELTWRL
jgi:hypothetical protein